MNSDREFIQQLAKTLIHMHQGAEVLKDYTKSEYPKGKANAYKEVFDLVDSYLEENPETAPELPPVHLN